MSVRKIESPMSWVVNRKPTFERRWILLRYVRWVAQDQGSSRRCLSLGS